MAKWLTCLLGTVVQDWDFALPPPPCPRIPGLRLGREGLKEPAEGLETSSHLQTVKALHSWLSTPEPLAL